MLFSLKYINVAMLTILKNVANVITASGETYFFKKHHGTQVWIALALMVCHIQKLEMFDQKFVLEVFLKRKDCALGLNFLDSITSFCNIFHYIMNIKF